MVRQSSNSKRRKVVIFMILFLSPVTSFNGSTDISSRPKNSNDEFVDINLKPKYEQIELMIITIATLVLLVSTTLFWVLWSYLDNVSTAKRCFLLYLYQDIIELALIASWFWFGLVTDCYVRGNGTILNANDSVIFSIGIVGFELEIGILATLAGIIKIYQTKQKQLDPPLPCHVDEQTVNRVIQLAVVASIHLFLILMSVEGFQPHLYYRFVGDNKTFFELSYWSAVLQSLVVFFFLFPLLMFILDFCYRKKESETFGLTMERKFQSAVFIMFVVAVIALFVTQFSPKFKDNFLIIGELLVFIACVIAPLYIIITSPSLRRFALNESARVLSLAIKTFENLLKCLKSFVDYRKRSVQIEPIV